MSFSSSIKEELSHQYGKARHCQLAELTALLACSGIIKQTRSGDFRVVIKTENLLLASKYEQLLRRLFHMRPTVLSRRSKRQRRTMYKVVLSRPSDALKVLQAIRFLSPANDDPGFHHCINSPVLHQECCRRAFLRGCFLCNGSVSDPEKAYHFEVVFGNEMQAEHLRALIGTFEIDARIVQRRKYHVVYVKDGSQIVDLLGFMGTRITLMELENIRIMHEMRGNVNRRVNCETANIHKTANAAVQQIEDIRLIIAKNGLHALPKELDEVAQLRLQYPEASLKEIGEMLSPPVGKSGVNHRFRKIKNFAENLR